MDTGNTGFIMICAALVFIMTPGLAFFYGGLVRRKNVVNTMMACVAIMGLSVFMWALFGYSLVFRRQSRRSNRKISDWLGLNGVGWDARSLCRQHSASRICRISDDVCNDYTGA